MKKPNFICKFLSSTKIFKLNVKTYSSKEIYNKGIKISKFIFPDVIKIIDNLPDDNYVIGVIYKDLDGNIDLQLTTTEHSYINEKVRNGMERGLLEELSLKIKNINNINWEPKIVRSSINSRAHFYYKIKLEDCDCIDSIEENKGVDDKSIHIISCVYGDYNNIINYFNNEKINRNNSDNIIGIWACKKDIAIEIIELLTENGKYIIPSLKNNYYLVER